MAKKDAPDTTEGPEFEARGPAASDRAAEREARRAANRREREERRAARQAERAARKAARGKDAGKGGVKNAADQPPLAAAHDPAPVPDPVPDPVPAPDAPDAAADPALRPDAELQAALRAFDRKRHDITQPQKLLAPEFNILILGQNGRLGIEAVLFAASLRRCAPGWRGRLIVAEPRPEGAWQGAQTCMPDPVHQVLRALNAEILPFTARHFGRDYPYGNKIEALSLLPADTPFMFFDSDTLITGEIAALALDFARPAASMRRSATWPVPPLYGPDYTDIWKSLYDRFGLDFESSLDLTQPDEHWERYLYFNAGWFMGRDAPEFGRLFTEYACAIRDEPGDALACQSLDPWLDQVAPPLVIHALGGGRPGPELAGLDGAVSCHYRNLSLLYAREPEPALDLIEDLIADPLIAPLLAGDEAASRLVAGGEGRQRIRPLFAGEDPPPPEQTIRHRLRKEGLWFR